MLKKYSHGFTLMELMITLVIISLLASIALPLYQNYVIKTQLVRAYSELETLRVDVEVCESDGNEGAECELSSLHSNLYIENPLVTFHPSKITATLGQQVVEKLQGGEISLTREVNGGWNCQINLTQTVPSSVYPKNCQHG